MRVWLRIAAGPACSFLIHKALPMKPTSTSNEPQYDSLFRLITERLYWFAIGPMFMILMLLGVINDEPERRIGYSVAYLVGLAGLPLSRWLEMRSGNALTAAGEPATWGQFRKYALIAVAVGLAGLLVVHAGVAFFFAPSNS